VKLRVVALAGLLAACGASTPPPDEQAGRDAASAADTAFDLGPDAADAPGPAACGETAPASRWAEWRIPDPVATAGPGAQAYDVGGGDVVVDRVTRLVWQRAVLPGSHTWDEARAACACLSLAGHDDWRLPTRMELVSLVDYTRSEPAIDVTAFPDTPPEWFWTSSPLADETLPAAAGAAFAWFVYFENGFSNYHETDARYRVRCLRDPGPPPAGGARYLVAADTVQDQRTGLTWQRRSDGQLRTWEAARASCQAPGLGGTGWRLPSMKELQSIVDEARANPAIDPVFGETPLDPFWTATPVVAAPGSAWRVSFPHGYTYDAAATNEYHARCVR
jgi:hypothetical protein